MKKLGLPKKKDTKNQLTLSERMHSVRKGLAFSPEKFAQVVGVSSRTIARWKSGEAKPDESRALFLGNIERLIVATEKSIEPEDLGRWILVPNTEFDGYAPVDLLQSGYATRLLIEALSG